MPRANPEQSPFARRRCATITVVSTPWQSHWHKHPGVRTGEQLSRGERSADRMRNVMGSWPFVFGFFAVMIVLQSPPAWASMSRYVRTARLLWSLVGVGTARRP